MHKNLNFFPNLSVQARLGIVPEKPSKIGYQGIVQVLAIQIPLLNATGTLRDKFWCHRHSERMQKHPLDNTQGFPAQNKTL